MRLSDYLFSRLSKRSVKIYLFEIKHFLDYMGEEAAEVATYKTIVDYLGWLRSRYDNPQTIHRILCAVKQYYFYLIESGKRSDHPCRFLRIKDHSTPPIQLQDLLKEEELQSLLERKERYPILAIRNQVIISLLIYQGLRIKEMCALKVSSVDVEKASIQIQATCKTNERTLKMKPMQVLLFYRYLNEVRPQLIGANTENLILTKRGTAEKGEGIHYLVSTYRKLFPTKKLTPTTIRQSMITNLLAAGTDLRIVQVFAGHKTTSATEKYRQTNYEALKESVDKFHPLDNRSFNEGVPLQ